LTIVADGAVSPVIAKDAPEAPVFPLTRYRDVVE
jgi:hypothetical protein